MWPHWRRFAVLGLLGVGAYNALQYLALQTSTPLNVTLVAASTPVWMLGIGWLFFAQPVSRRQMLGALLSIIGVLVVLSRGQWAELAGVRLVPGDLYVLLATAAWAFYSWMLSQPKEPSTIRSGWAAFLMAQVVFGLGWSGLFAASEWALTDAHIRRGLAAGRRPAVRGGRPGHSGLPLLGYRRVARRSRDGWLLCQPHAPVCSAAVSGFSG